MGEDRFRLENGFVGRLELAIHLPHISHVCGFAQAPVGGDAGRYRWYVEVKVSYCTLKS
jgi:hypothetical protein